MNPVREGRSVSRGWIRLKWDPDEGITHASGDCQGLLGVEARRLVSSPEPLSLLFSELAVVLAQGLPRVPVFISSASLTGTVSAADGRADIVLFGVPGLQDRSNVMLDELGAGIVGTDRSGVIDLWNRTMSTIFRIPRKHALGKKLQDVLTAPVLYSWDNVIKMVLEGKQIKVVCRPDAQRRIECTFTLGGNGVVGTCFDTTESFQAENRLRTSRKMNQAYFHSVSTGLVLFDKDYRILVANRSFGRMFGLVENLLGIHLHEILPRESYEILEDQTRPFFESGTGEKEEVRTAHFLLPDRNRRIVQQDVHPILEDSGDVFYAVGIFEDISELTLLRESYGNHIETIRKILKLYEHPVRGISNQQMLQRIMNCLSASAAALYLIDPTSDKRLTASAGNWPENMPEVYSELRLPSVAADKESGNRLTGESMGELRDHFSSCLTFSLESENRSYGHLVLAYSSGAFLSDMYPLAELAAWVMRDHLEFTASETRIEHLDLLLGRQRELVSRVVESLDVPVAVFRMDWSVLEWNDPMEELTGVSSKLAFGRSEIAANILFSGIGGISAVQRLVRNGNSEFPESWEVENQDGDSTRCTWRIVRTEAVEGRNLEPVLVVAGVQSDDVYSIAAAKKATETYSALSRGTSALLSAPDRGRVEEAAATALLEISGASRITLKLRGIDPVTRTSYDQRGFRKGDEYWTLPLETETEIIGEAEFNGGREYAAMKDFARNVARTCVELEKSAVGRRFAFLAERAAGKFFITNSSGRILLSTWMEMTGGDISNRTIYDMFSGSDWSDIDACISGIIKKGRLDMTLLGSEGEEVQLAAVSLDGHDGESLLIWWPVSTMSYRHHVEHMNIADRAEDALSEFLDELLGSISGGFSRIKDVLNPDHPVSSILNTTGYAFQGMEKAFLYMRLLNMARDAVPRRINSQSFLETISSGCMDSGVITPVARVKGELYDISGSLELLKEVMVRICQLLSGDTGAVYSVSVIKRNSLETTQDLLQFHERYIRFRLSGQDPVKTRADEDGILSLSDAVDCSAGISPAAETALLCLVLRMAGGTLRRDPGKGSYMILLPCID